MSLAEDLRREREDWLDVGGFRFLIVRPRELEIARWNAEGGTGLVAIRSVAGWENVTIGDIRGGAKDDTPAEFSRGLAEEWLPDRLDLLVTIWEAIERRIELHRLRREDAKKN